MAIYLVKARRAIRTIETTTFNVEADTLHQARVKARATLGDDNCEWTHERGPDTSQPSIEGVEILVTGDEELPE